MEKYVNLDDVENRVIALSNIIDRSFIEYGTLSGALSTLLSGLIQSINELPTKELDDFTEGIWEDIDSPLSIVYTSQCSECGDLGNNRWEFCPHCGARMSGYKGEYIDGEVC